MSDELETAGMASLGGLSAGGEADLSGQPCRNCGEMVDQRHCPRCGQLAASFHRPFFSLITESVSDSLALDGRLARTLPLLLFRPGVLTRRYTEGKRARYVPPFRLFLLSSLVFYFTVFAFLGQVNWLDIASGSIDGQELTREEVAQIRDFVIANEGEFDQEEVDAFIRSVRERTSGEPAEGGTDGQTEGETGPTIEAPPPDVVSELPEIEQLVERIIRDPRLFIAAIETWLPRLSLLLVPLTMLTMALMYAWRRRVYIYDHAVHALNLHSWMYLAATVAILLGMLIGPGSATGIFFLILPVYVTLSLRGAYRSGIFTSLLRMFVLFFFWWFAVIFLGVAVAIASALSI